MSIRVLIWNEFRHEKKNPAVQAIYPNGMHQVIGEFLREANFEINTATLDEPEHGVSEDALNETDVLIWWGHMAHDEVDDAIVDRVQERVLRGMGLIVLHSGHFSKIFKRLMGTTCNLKWRDIGEKERLWIVNPAHPIASGLGEFIDIPAAEMYGEHFDIPEPDSLVMVSWFEGGEIFRSACCYHRGMGKIFYFRPGHETYPIFYQDEIQQVIINGVHWAAPCQPVIVEFGNVPEMRE